MNGVGSTDRQVRSVSGLCRAAQCDRRTHSDAERTCRADSIHTARHDTDRTVLSSLAGITARPHRPLILPSFAVKDRSDPTSESGKCYLATERRRNWRKRVPGVGQRDGRGSIFLHPTQPNPTHPSHTYVKCRHQYCRTNRSVPVLYTKFELSSVKQL